MLFRSHLVLVLFIPAIHVKLPDVVYRQLVPLQLDLVGVWREFAREVPHVIRECGGEQDNLHLLPVLGQHAVRPTYAPGYK